MGGSAEVLDDIQNRRELLGAKVFAMALKRRRKILVKVLDCSSSSTAYYPTAE